MVQVFANGLVAGALYLLAGLAVAIILRTTHVLSFAVGAYITIGAYSAYVFLNWLHCPMVFAALVGAGCTGFVAATVEFVVLEPLRWRRARPLAIMICSLGAYIVLSSVVSIVFGYDVRTIWLGGREGVAVFGARVTLPQMMAAITAVGVAVLQVMFSRYTVLGLTVRAVGSDAELSTAMGVSTTRMRVTAAGAGGAIAGLAGVLLGMQSGLMPTMGLHLFLMGLIVAIIGGAHTLVGICLAASLLGMAEHWGAWWLSSQWQGTIAFLILMFFMVLRPKGLVAGWTQGRSV